jgi:SAM-dependent methyltransferase
MRPSDRVNPGWFDHARMPLLLLRRAVQTALDDWIALASGGVVVDVGCGDSPYRAMFESKGLKYIACDLGEPADVIITPNHPIPLPDGSADLVVSFQVLEHVWELDWYLGECRRLLKPNGKFLISTHGMWLYHPHPQDFRRWTHTGLVRQLGESGLVVSQMVGMVGPLALTTQIRLIGYREVLGRIPILGAILFAPIVLCMNLRIALEERITPSGMKFDHASTYLCLCDGEQTAKIP